MSRPFARAIAMMALIEAAMASASPRQAMEMIGPYVSRGKGKGVRQASTNTVAQDKRNAVKARNRLKHRRRK